MNVFEKDHEGHTLVAKEYALLPTTTSYFWIVHTGKAIDVFLKKEEASACLAAGGAILFVSRGGSYENYTPEGLASQTSALETTLAARVHALREPFRNGTVEKVKLFIDRIVQTLSANDDIPWSELDGPPAPDALVAYYLLSFLDDVPQEERQRVRDMAKTEWIAINASLQRIKSATGNDVIDDPKLLGAFIRGIREDL